MSRTVKKRYYGFNNEHIKRNPYQHRTKWKDYWFYVYNGHPPPPNYRKLRRYNKAILEKSKQRGEYDECYSLKWLKDPESKYW